MPETPTTLLVLVVSRVEGDMQLIREGFRFSPEQDFAFVFADTPEAAEDVLKEKAVHFLLFNHSDFSREAVERLTQKALLHYKAPIVCYAMQEQMDAMPAIQKCEALPRLLSPKPVDSEEFRRLAFFVLQQREDLLDLQQNALTILHSQRRLQRIVEQMGDAVLIVNREGVVRFANPMIEQIFDRPKEDFMHQAFGYPIYVDDPPEIDIIRDDAKRVVAEMRAVETTWNDEEVYLVTLRDVTRRYEMEEEQARLNQRIQQVQKMESLGVLAGGIAHDFNNILMSIMGSVSLMLEDDREEDLKQNLQNIWQSSERAADLARQMLAFAGRGRFLMGVVEITTLVQDMSQLILAALPKMVEVHFHLNPSLPRFRADAAQIRQIVMSLLINSAEAIGEEVGTITIRTEARECSAEELSQTYLDDPLEPGAYIILEVADTGPGIRTEEIHQLFDPFYTTKFMGRGLGLAAVLGIVRGHEGAIRVDNLPEGGARFRVYFPVSQELLKKDQPDPEVNKKYRILVVDDETSVRDLACRMLQRAGYRTAAASNINSAMEIICEKPGSVNAVILDMTMPGVSVRQAYSRILDAESTMPILVSSGYSATDALAQFGNFRPDGFLQKPYRYQTLLEKLQVILQTGSTP